MGTTERESEHVGVRMDADLKQQVRMEAARRGITISQFMREIAQEEVEER